MFFPGKKNLTCKTLHRPPVINVLKASGYRGIKQHNLQKVDADV